LATEITENSESAERRQREKTERKRDVTMRQQRFTRNNVQRCPGISERFGRRRFSLCLLSELSESSVISVAAVFSA